MALRRLRDAEVGDADDPVEADNRVLRADVAVDDVQRGSVFTRALVRGMEAIEDVARDRRGDVDREAAARMRRRPEELREVDTLDPVHDDRRRTGGAVHEAEHAHDVRVTDRAAQTRLVLEARKALRIVREEGVKLLHRHVLSPPGGGPVVHLREVDRCRSTDPERPHNLETAHAVRHGRQRISGRHRGEGSSTRVPCALASLGDANVFLRCPQICGHRMPSRTPAPITTPMGWGRRDPFLRHPSDALGVQFDTGVGSTRDVHGRITSVVGSSLLPRNLRAVALTPVPSS